MRALRWAGSLGIAVLLTGCTVRVSVDAASISADGRAVAFESFATDLVAGDASGTVDVFLRPIPYGPQ
jgi:hypothetical protein